MYCLKNNFQTLICFRNELFEDFDFNDLSGYIFSTFLANSTNTTSDSYSSQDFKKFISKTVSSAKY